MQDITTVIIGISLIVLATTVARLNDKVDKQIQKFKRFEDALKKNATGSIPKAEIFEEEKEEIYR